MPLFRSLTIAFLAWLCITLAWDVPARSLPRPAKLADAVGSWVGSAETGVMFVRMELAADGTGWIATQFGRGKAKLYRVTSWKLRENWWLTVTAAPVDGSEQALIIEGATLSPQSDLNIHNGKEWTSPLILYREEEFAEGSRATKERILQR